MSVTLMAQVWKSSLPDQQQKVMLALADHAHDDGTHVYPTVDYLAWKCNMDRRTVQRYLRAFEKAVEKGAHQRRPLLEVVVRSEGRYASVYRILIDNIPMKAPYEAPNRGTTPPLEEEVPNRGTTPPLTAAQDASNGGVQNTNRGVQNIQRRRETAATIMESPYKPLREPASLTIKKKSTEQRAADREWHDQKRAQVDLGWLERQRQEDEAGRVAKHKELQAKLREFDAKNSFRQRMLDRRAAEREARKEAQV